LPFPLHFRRSALPLNRKKKGKKEEYSSEALSASSPVPLARFLLETKNLRGLPRRDGIMVCSSRDRYLTAIMKKNSRGFSELKKHPP